MATRQRVHALVLGRRLTAREAEILSSIRLRKTNSEIAAELHISRRTVESHVASLLRKFGVENRHLLAARMSAPNAAEASTRTPDGLLRPVSTAELDLSGVIVTVNASWVRFCLENGGDPARSGVGRSYLAVCASAGDELSAHVGDCIRTALGGGVFVPLRIRMPCGISGDYDMLVSSRVDDRGALVGATVSVSPSRAVGPDLGVGEEGGRGPGGRVDPRVPGHEGVADPE